MYSAGVESQLWPLQQVPFGVQSGCILPWVMEQNEVHPLFLHWPVSGEQLRRVIPETFELDSFRGPGLRRALIPFRMTDVRMRGLPQIPGTNNFPELDF